MLAKIDVTASQLFFWLNLPTASLRLQLDYNSSISPSSAFFLPRTITPNLLSCHKCSACSYLFCLLPSKGELSVFASTFSPLVFATSWSFQAVSKSALLPKTFVQTVLIPFAFLSTLFCSDLESLTL